MVTLYIKTHNDTGLKYFGKTYKYQTYKEIHDYQGSGIHWQRHIKKYNYNVKTEIYAKFEEECQELIDTAIKFSMDNNIINSKEWANLINENGLDGGDVRNGMINSPEHRRKISESQKGIPKPRLLGNTNGFVKGHNTWNKGLKETRPEVLQKISDTHKGKEPYNKGQTGGTNSLKGIVFPKVECPYCNKLVGENSKNRYHFNNCKKKL